MALLVASGLPLREPLDPGAWPGALFGGVALLALGFQRSRALGALAAVAAVYLLRWGFPQGPPGWPVGTQEGLFTIVLPLELAGLSLLAKDRSPFRLPGWAPVGLAVAPLLFGLALTAGSPETVHGLVTADWAGFDLRGASDTAWLALGLGLLAITTVAVARAGTFERGLLWLAPLAFVATAWTPGTGGFHLLFGAAAGVIGISVLETAYALAFRDELTGLPGRRALRRAFEELTPPYVVGMVDVDHFKKFNDRHGHEVGDQVLRMVAAHLARAGGGSRAYRYGGEEFTLLFPGKELEEAAPHLSELRKEIAAADFTLRGPQRPHRRPKKPKSGSGRRVKVTVSIGAAEPGRGKRTPDEVVEAADRALYKAKDQGRNRVVF